MASFDYPPLTPDPDPSPLSPTIPLNPPMVGEASPFDHVDGQNRDLILEAIRSWIRHPLRDWTTAWQNYLVYWLALVSAWLNDFVTAADEYITEHAISGYSWRTTATNINPTGTTTVTFTGVDTDHRPLIIGDLVSDQSYTKQYGVITSVVDASHAVVQSLGFLSGLNGHSWWPTATTINPATPTVVTLTPEAGRPPQIGDFVFDGSTYITYGKITHVTDDSTVTVTPIGSLRGLSGFGWWTTTDVITGGAIVLTPGLGRSPQIGDLALSITGNNTYGRITAVTDDTHVTADYIGELKGATGATGAAGATGATGATGADGAPGVVQSVVAGTNVTVDAADPANPIVSATGGGGGGIPLAVYASIDRPDALVNGDAYFDSTLIIPVWSYGGVWRDSAGVVTHITAPTTDYTFVEKSSHAETGGGPTHAYWDWSGLTATIDAHSGDWASMGRVTFVGSVAYIGFGNGAFIGYELFAQFDPTDPSAFTGTAAADIPTVPFGAVNFGVLDWWAESGELHLLMNTDGDFVKTLHLSYDGSAFTDIPIHADISGNSWAQIMRYGDQIYLAANDLSGAPAGIYFAADLTSATALVDADYYITSSSTTVFIDTGSTRSGPLVINQTTGEIVYVIDGVYNSTVYAAVDFTGIEMTQIYNYDGSKSGATIKWSVGDFTGDIVDFYYLKDAYTYGPTPTWIASDDPLLSQSDWTPAQIVFGSAENYLAMTNYDPITGAGSADPFTNYVSATYAYTGSGGSSYVAAAYNNDTSAQYLLFDRASGSHSHHIDVVKIHGVIGAGA